MQPTTRREAVTALGVLLMAAGAYGTGRFAQPARVETRTLTVDKVRLQSVEHLVEHTVTVRSKAMDKVVERTITVTKDGETKTVERIVYRDREAARTEAVKTTDKATVQTTEHKAEATKVTTAEQPRITLGAGVGGTLALAPFSAGPAYLVIGSYRIAGPLSVGAWGSFSQARAEPSAGVLVTLTF